MASTDAVAAVNASDPSDILDDALLFVGNARCAEEHGASFDLVVNCTKNLPLPAAKEGRKDIRIPIDDDPHDALSLFQILRDTSVLDDIDATLARGGRCLVHCMAGAQRSAAVAACFLVARRGFAPDAAVRHVRARRRAAFFFGIVNLERAIAMASLLRPLPLDAQMHTDVGARNSVM